MLAHDMKGTASLKQRNVGQWWKAARQWVAHEKAMLTKFGPRPFPRDVCDTYEFRQENGHGFTLLMRVRREENDA